MATQCSGHAHRSPLGPCRPIATTNSTGERYSPAGFCDKNARTREIAPVELEGLVGPPRQKDQLHIEPMAATLIGRDAQFRAHVELARRLAASATDPRSLTELFRALYEETARAMDATVFLFAVYDEASETVRVVRQMDRGIEHPGGSFPLGKGFTSEVIRTGTPKLIRNWSTEGPPVRLLYGTEAKELVAPQSGVVVPILSGERVLGVVSAQSYRPEAYDSADLLRLAAIAAQAGIAFELEAVLATMTDAVLIVDARGAIVQLNRAARELLGLDGASLVLGQPLEQQRLEQWPETAREIAAALAPSI